MMQGMSVRETFNGRGNTWPDLVEAGFIIKTPPRHLSSKNEERPVVKPAFQQLRAKNSYLQDSTCFNAAEMPASE